MKEEETILIVDDDKSTQNILKLTLGEKGYTTETAGTGREAIKKTRSRFYNVVLLDIKLPDMQGTRLLTRLKKIHKDMEIIIITGYASMENAVQALNKGASAYIIKPLDMDDLLARLKELLCKQRKALQDKKLYQRVKQELNRQRQAEQSLQESKKKVESLHKVARKLAACQTETKVFQLTIKAAKQLLSFSVYTLSLAEGKRLVTKSASSQITSFIKRGMALDENLVIKTYRTGRTFVLDRSEGTLEGNLIRKNFQSILSTPVGDIGVFQAISPVSDAFNREDMRLLKLLLDHTTVALRRIHLQDEFKEKAVQDPLTGVYNRYYLNQALQQEIKRSKRYGHPIGFLMVDIDRFKEINDRFGHQVGDKILQEVACLLLEEVREIDVVVRYGGDEFLVMLPETDGNADIVRQRIARKIASRDEINKMLNFPATLSIGSAYWSPQGSRSVNEILGKADERMYEDKRKKSSDHLDRCQEQKS